MSIIKKYPVLLILFSLILISFVYNYHSIINQQPFSIHQWRQADCTAFAINYWKQDLPFHKPAILNAGRTKDGKIAAEFPVIYYIVGKLWSVFGQHHFIFRIINILIVFAGLLYLFKFVNLFLDNIFWSAFIPILLFTSPGLVYYTNNFLPDAPAFGLALIGWYHFGKFYKQKESRNLLWSMLFFAFAGLLKITALMNFIAILGLFVFELVGILRNKEKIFFNLPKHSLYLLLVPVLALPWYFYAHGYNEINNKEFFLMKILPIWKMSSEEIFTIAKKVYSEILPAYLNRWAIFLMLLLFLFNIVLLKKTKNILILLSIFIFIGSLSYIALFFQQFKAHDYYFINLLVLPLFVFLTTLQLLKKNFNIFYHKPGLKLIAGIVLLACIYYASGTQRLKYDHTDKFGNSNFLINNKEKELYKWFAWDCEKYTRPFDGITPYIRSLGIERDDLVITIPDFSYNITLYFMDQMGYTKTTFLDIPLEEKIDEFLRLGAKYLVIYNEDSKEWGWVRPYLTKQIGTYQGIEIYDLREF